jgi:hypothetical protein
MPTPLSPAAARAAMNVAIRKYGTPVGQVQSGRPEYCIQYGIGSGRCAIERVGVESRHRRITKVLG